MFFCLFFWHHTYCLSLPVLIRLDVLEESGERELVLEKAVSAALQLNLARGRENSDAQANFLLSKAMIKV